MYYFRVINAGHLVRLFSVFEEIDESVRVELDAPSDYSAVLLRGRLDWVYEEGAPDFVVERHPTAAFTGAFVARAPGIYRVQARTRVRLRALEPDTAFVCDLPKTRGFLEGVGLPPDLVTEVLAAPFAGPYHDLAERARVTLRPDGTLDVEVLGAELLDDLGIGGADGRPAGRR